MFALFPGTVKSRKRRYVPCDDCRPMAWVCIMALSLVLVWGLVYMPIREGSRYMQLLPEHLSWMADQHDLSRYLAPDNDTSLLEPAASRHPCNGSVYIAVVVCSAVPNFIARQAIRDTWARDAQTLRSVRVFFLLGRSQNSSLNAQVANESLAHRDIIQEDFLDTYNNLTLKSGMMLKWAVRQCRTARFIMKTDDDMFVNLPNLFRLLKSRSQRKLLLGCLLKGIVPVRDWKSKWFMPNAIFPGRSYPQYLSGTSYVMSSDVACQLYQTALATPFFYLEDIFVTGICAARAGIKPVNHDGFNFWFRRGSGKVQARKNDPCAFRGLITAHKMSPKELVKMWKSLQNPSLKCKRRK